MAPISLKSSKGTCMKGGVLERKDWTVEVLVDDGIKEGKERIRAKQGEFLRIGGRGSADGLKPTEQMVGEEHGHLGT